MPQLLFGRAMLLSRLSVVLLCCALVVNPLHSADAQIYPDPAGTVRPVVQNAGQDLSQVLLDLYYLQKHGQLPPTKQTVVAYTAGPESFSLPGNMVPSDAVQLNANQLNLLIQSIYYELQKHRPVYSNRYPRRYYRNPDYEANYATYSDLSYGTAGLNTTRPPFPNAPHPVNYGVAGGTLGTTQWPMEPINPGNIPPPSPIPNTEPPQIIMPDASIPPPIPAGHSNAEDAPDNNPYVSQMDGFTLNCYHEIMHNAVDASQY